MESNRTISAAQRSPVNICVLCAVWNAEEWIGRSLDSIAAQRYPHFRCAVIDDASTDATWAIAQERIARNDRFIGWQNDTRLDSTTENHIAAVEAISKDPWDVMVVVDGDDWLAHPGVFDEIAAVYADPDVWLTYGSFQLWRNKLLERWGVRAERGWIRAYPDFVAEHNLFRYYHFEASHLRTWRRFLWDRIDSAHLKGPDDRYVNTAGDVATMIPMLEMAGPAHIRYIDSLLYIYNHKNPLSMGRTRRSEQDLVDLQVRALPRYRPLQQGEIEAQTDATAATPARLYRGL
ncbi:glycosyltransferase family 2 protein [Salinisphaera aquimarina]|uniref:Glycosyltransferase family 2 protein n=1 Tax=Salinisphaera aquimarina TaxID=2094031 RepID=A0ABV7ESH6_9GAMM